MHPSIDHLLQFFKYEHLPPRLQAISKPFAELAHSLCGCDVDGLDGPEATAGLRKLLEAKDCMVRAALTKPKAEG